MTPKKPKELLSLRIDADLHARLLDATKDHRVENLSDTLAWLLDSAVSELEGREKLRRAWAHEFEKRHGNKAVVSVRVHGPVRSESGAETYRARATVNGEESDLLGAEIDEVRPGEFRVHLFHPTRENIPPLVFDVLSSAYLEEAATVSGWEGEGDLSLGLTRKVSEIDGLPIWKAPGEGVPEHPPERSIGGSE